MEGSVATITGKIRPVEISKLMRRLEKAETPAELVRIEVEIEAIEHLMRETGLYNTKEIRPVNELRMRARWKLGKALAKVERGKPGPAGKDKGTGYPQLKTLLAEISLDKRIAILAQRIGTLPDGELEKAFVEARDNDILSTFDDLIVRARPYWYKANRQRRHRGIAAGAKMTLQDVGPFPLIYADPPWKFEIYSEKGLERTPDQHYATLSDEEIIDFKVRGLGVSDIAHEDAALFLWCTSSNVHRALAIMEAWDFDFKASAVWVKDKGGLGLIFRNWHEILLYGTRGKMPGPQYQPPSAFKYPRGKHSAKPPEIRKEIEKMYPDFDKATRLELFARGKIEGWSTYGLEAG